MSSLERMVWAAAYAAECGRQMAWCGQYGYSIDKISGSACAGRADVAVVKLREALTGDDKEYLLPVVEEWDGAS